MGQIWTCLWKRIHFEPSPGKWNPSSTWVAQFERQRWKKEPENVAGERLDRYMLTHSCIIIIIKCWIGWTRHIAIASNLIFSKKKCQPSISISILFLLRELSLSTSLILSKCLVPPPYFHHYMCCCCRFSVVPFYANYSLYTQTQLLLPTNLNYPFATAGYLHSHSLAQRSYSWHFHFY